LTGFAEDATNRGVKAMYLESAKANRAERTLLAWALSVLILVLPRTSAFCEETIAGPGVADTVEQTDMLATELKEGAAANRDRLVNSFCRRMFLDSEQRDAGRDGQWELKRAEGICARCKVSQCPEYQEWLERDVARQAAEIRAARSDCLDRTLSRSEVIRCRYTMKPYLNHW
jgi:hypothetical protein